MKKVLAVILSALMLFSCFAVSAFAVDGEQVNVFVTYKALDENGKVQDVTIGPKAVLKGAAIEAATMQAWLADMPKNFEESYTLEEDGYSRTESKIYTFAGFIKENDDSETKYWFGVTDEINEDTTFVATYVVEDTGEYWTFFEVVEYVFAQINRIFEYFASIFGF